MQTMYILCRPVCMCKPYYTFVCKPPWVCLQAWIHAQICVCKLCHMCEVLCICICKSVYICEAICVQVLCVRTYLYMQAHIHMYVSHVHICARLYMYMQAHICMIPLCVCERARTCVCAHKPMCTYICNPIPSWNFIWSSALWLFQQWPAQMGHNLS